MSRGRSVKGRDGDGDGEVGLGTTWEGNRRRRATRRHSDSDNEQEQVTDCLQLSAPNRVSWHRLSDMSSIVYCPSRLHPCPRICVFDAIIHVSSLARFFETLPFLHITTVAAARLPLIHRQTRLYTCTLQYTVYLPPYTTPPVAVDRLLY